MAQRGEPVITIIYTSIDRLRKRRTFKTLAGARRFAHKWVGAHPDPGSFYAVSSDGIGKVEWTGTTFDDLFPAS